MGFNRLPVGETDISYASRPIKCKEFNQTVKNDVEFIEVTVAYDVLSVVVNPKNTWVDSLTIDELKMIFLDDKAAASWHDVRPEWPDTPIEIYAPGTDSGTFDYFKEVVAGKKGSIRSDMSVSEDDNVLVRGVAGDPGAIGFFGVAYYEENTDKLKIVPIVNPDSGKAVIPTSKTIADGEYAPFSRPLFIYVNSKSIRRPEVKRFVDFYVANAAKLAAEVGYVKLPDSIYAKARKNIKRRTIGTCYLSAEGNKIEGPITALYK